MFLLPIKSKNPPESWPVATLALIFFNTLAFALTCTRDLSIQPHVAYQYGLTYNNLSPLTLFTSIFLHGDLMHLLGNMWFLYLFGFPVEGRLRTPKFLLVYFVAGACGGLAQTLLLGRLEPNMPGVGASGAIMGILGAAMYMFPHGKISFFYFVGYWWHGIFNVPMWGVGLLYLGMDALFAAIGSSVGGGVAHLAHLGGAVGGFFAGLLFRPKRDSRDASEAKAMYTDTRDFSTLTAFDMRAMIQSNPDDTKLVLFWMHRSLRENRVMPDCHEAFFRLLPQILQKEEIQVVGFVLSSIALTPGFVKPGTLLLAAAKLEQAQDHGTALRLYDAVLGDQGSAPADREAALFRSALLSETAFRNLPRAAQGYEEIIKWFPMGPFADQARLRLSNLHRQPKP